MLYVVAFVVGILLGGTIARQIAKRHWAKILRSDRQAIIAQYESKLSDERQQHESAEATKRQLQQQITDCQQREEHDLEQIQSLSENVRSQRDQIEDLERRIEHQIERHAQQQQQLSQSLEEKLALCEKEHLSILSSERQKAQVAILSVQEDCNVLQAENTALQTKSDRCEAALDEEKHKNSELQAAQSKLQKKWDKHRDDNSAAIEIRVDLERQNSDLLSENRKLQSNIQKLEASIIQKEEELEAAYGQSDLNPIKIVKKLFPEIQLLHDSEAEIREHKSKFISLLVSFKNLENNSSLPQLTKIQGTDYDLWEYRVARQGRVYYHCAQTDTDTTHYKVVVAWKHNDQEQQQVINWFKTGLKDNTVD